MQSPLPRAGNIALAAFVSLFLGFLFRRRTNQSTN